jgi:cell shape-determining protein MreC
MKKNIIFLMVLFVNVLVFSQKTNSDTTEMCIPYSVAKKILIDLNNYDKLQEVSKTYKEEIYQLSKKVDLLKKENESWEKEDNLNREIKNGLYNIISAIIIVPLTYLAITK